MKLQNYEILGIDKRDMRIYESLYRMNDASLRSLAAETGLNRGTVYETIKKLTELGLVTFTQHGERRRYAASDPAVLLALIRERRDQLVQLEQQADQYIQQMQLLRQGTGSSYFAKFYEGDEGVASILRDVLQTASALESKEYCVISARAASTFLYANFKSFSRQRIKLGIYARVLADRPATKVALSERRQITAAGQSLSGYVILYGTKTALISLGQANRLSGIIIEDEGITSMQKIIFDQLWNGSKA